MKDEKTDAGGRGQKMNTGYGQDNSSYKVNNDEAMGGKKMGGSTTNLGHSLTGASAVQGVKGKSGKDDD